MRLTGAKVGRALVVPFVLAASLALAKTPGDWSVAEIKKALDAPGAHDALVLAAPVGIDGDSLRKQLPAQNPLTPAKVALGKELYFDTRLSADSSVSCASCHRPDHGWGDPDRFSSGVGKKLGGRHAPTVINRALSTLQFWDGRAASLEEQALGPVQNPVEMNMKLDEAVGRLNAIEGYRIQFERIFGGPATNERVAHAIAAFERTILAGGSRVDLDDEVARYAQVDLDDPDTKTDVKVRAKAARETAKAHPLTDAERRGKALYTGKANCSLCHAGENYTDEQFYNLGVGADAKEPDLGLAAVTKKPEDEGKFKTPTLRNAADRPPYMHDGSEATLEAVVDFYDRGGGKNKNLSSRIKPLGLTAEEKADLVQFLKALSGEVTKVEKPKLP
jgi:cytochrome c peroxidase